MSEQLEQNIRACMDFAKARPDFPYEPDGKESRIWYDVNEADIQATIAKLVTLIHEREKLWVAEVGQLKIDLHFAHLAQEAEHERERDERDDWNEQIEEAERKMYECLDRQEVALNRLNRYFAGRLRVARKLHAASEDEYRRREHELTAARWQAKQEAIQTVAKNLGVELKEVE